MNEFLNLRSRRFVPVGLIALAAAVLLAPAPASATPYVVKLVQQGSNVVATGSGEFDLSGLAFDGGSLPGNLPGIAPYDDIVYIGAQSSIDYYNSFTGPAFFGPGNGTDATTGAGDSVGLDVGVQYLEVPAGYTSGTALSDSATWDSATFTSLGVTPGTYVWSWGSAADQRFTLIIGGSGGGTAVPEPAALGMFGFGVLLIGGFVGLRRRAAWSALHKNI